MAVAESPFNVAQFFLQYDELELAVEKSTPRTFRRNVGAWLQHLDGLPDLVRPIFQQLEASANVNHWMLQYLGVSPGGQVRGPIQLPTGRWERLGTQLAILRLWVKDDETAAGFLNNIGPKGKSEQEGYRALIDQFFLPTQRELRRFMWDEISHLEPPMILRRPQMDIKSAEITLSDVPPGEPANTAGSSPTHANTGAFQSGAFQEGTFQSKPWSDTNLAATAVAAASASGILSSSAPGLSITTDQRHDLIERFDKIQGALERIRPLLPELIRAREEHPGIGHNQPPPSFEQSENVVETCPFHLLDDLARAISGNVSARRVVPKSLPGPMSSWQKDRARGPAPTTQRTV